MPTTEDYLNQLQADRQALIDNLIEQGVEVTGNETFTNLTPKVLDINGAEPNIFLQTTEPDTKDGIWIQTNKSYNNIVVDENVYNLNEWMNEEGAIDTIIRSVSTSISFKYNNDVYVWCADLNTYGLYKYNKNTNTFVKLTLNLVSGEPKYGYPYGAKGAIIDNYFVLYSPYSMGGRNDIIKINLNTLQITEEASKLTGDTYGYGSTTAYYNGYFYEFGAQRASGNAYYDKVRKIDYINKTSTVVGNISNARNTYTSAYNSIQIGNIVYLFDFSQGSGYSKWTTFNLETETFGQYYNLPAGLCLNQSGGAGFLVSLSTRGNIIYLIYNGVWKLDISTNQITKITSNLPNSATIIASSNTIELDGNILLIGGRRTISGTATWTDKSNKFKISNKTYNNGDLVIRQGTGGYTTTKTEMFSIGSTGKLLMPIADVFLYTDNTLYMNLPTYIGDGTNWNLLN